MVPCALALVMLVDVSGSISSERYALQHAGFAAAMTDPRIVSAMVQQEGGLALTVIEWSDQRRTVVPWHMIHNADDVSAVAEMLAGAERSMTGSTAMGDAMVDGIAAFDQAPCQPTRKIIDVSGDGRNNDGRARPDDVRVHASELNITVNGLPIQGEEAGVVDYYRQHVVTSDGFVIEATGFEDVARAIRVKLVMEVGGTGPTVASR